MAQFVNQKSKHAGMDGSFVNARLNQVFSTRFANSAIHQNFTDFEANLQICLIHGKKRITLTTNSMKEARVAEAVDKRRVLVTHTCKVSGRVAVAVAVVGAEEHDTGCHRYALASLGHRHRPMRAALTQRVQHGQSLRPGEADLVQQDDRTRSLDRTGNDARLPDHVARLDAVATEEVGTLQRLVEVHPVEWAV